MLDEETGAIFLVMKRHTFCMKIVIGQSVESLCELLFDQCIDKDQLDKKDCILRECTKALGEHLLKMETFDNKIKTEMEVRCMLKEY